MIHLYNDNNITFDSVNWSLSLDGNEWSPQIGDVEKDEDGTCNRPKIIVPGFLTAASCLGRDFYTPPLPPPPTPKNVQQSFVICFNASD